MVTTSSFRVLGRCTFYSYMIYSLLGYGSGRANPIGFSYVLELHFESINIVADYECEGL